MDSGVQFDFLYRTPETGLVKGDKAKAPVVVASPPPPSPAAAAPAAAAAK